MELGWFLLRCGMVNGVSILTRVPGPPRTASERLVQLHVMRVTSGVPTSRASITDTHDDRHVRLRRRTFSRGC